MANYSLCATLGDSRNVARDFIDIDHGKSFRPVVVFLSGWYKAYKQIHPGEQGVSVTGAFHSKILLEDS